MKSATPLQRFQRKYEVRESGCWEWTASRDGEPRSPTANPRGRYGRFALDGTHMIGAHRAAYLLFRGSIPEGRKVLHACDNPPCVNPAHLFLGTTQDNSDDKLAKGRAWHQAPGAVSPRTGTGVGRMVPGKGCVVDAVCAVCDAPMVQRISAYREGKAAVCSTACKGRLNGARSRTSLDVPCANCGTSTRKHLANLKKNRRAFCCQSCVSRFYAKLRAAV